MKNAAENVRTSDEWFNQLIEVAGKVAAIVPDTKKFLDFFGKWDKNSGLSAADSSDYANWEMADFYEDFFEPSGNDEYDRQQTVDLFCDYLASGKAAKADIDKANSLI